MKHYYDLSLAYYKKSHPTRVRGLKLLCVRKRITTLSVAPHAGAWIETNRAIACQSRMMVAPHAGAWIETKRWI